MKKLLVITVLAVTSMALVQCAPKTSKSVSSAGPTPEEKVAEIKKNFTDDQLAQGKTIFEANCQKCHKLKEPPTHTVQSWEGIIPGMAKKAHLDETQTSLVRAYILSNAKMS
ncbi:cytochrome c [Taibaiella soli]|uniref:Cytochrome C n=1 Tax=Taibaiella soli TaxID=1649169 RepID=A0A2W2BXF4_9BACT|nr:cytochrome C [Taibaiella soli]PZF72543.1 cytochrome C [Taibaiella soli]